MKISIQERDELDGFSAAITLGGEWRGRLITRLAALSSRLTRDSLAAIPRFIYCSSTQ